MIVRSLALWALFVVCASHAAAQSYQYDERGRLERVTYSDCSTVRYFYDPAGNRTERITLQGDGACAGNQAPNAQNDTITMAPGVEGLFDLTASHGSGNPDTDPDQHSIRIISIDQGNVPLAGGALGIQLQSDRRQVQIKAPNTEGTYTFRYRIEDTFGLTSDADVTLIVEDAQPVSNLAWVSGSVASVYEGQVVTTYDVEVTGGSGEGPYYTIEGGQDSDFFNINYNTGLLKFNSAPDYEDPSDSNHNNTYEVVLGVTDGIVLVEQPVSIAVLNINDNTPVWRSGFSVSVSEGSGLAVYTARATDSDGQTPTYSIYGGADSGQFSINGNTGVLTFQSAPDFENPTDSNLDNNYEVTLLASDGSNTREKDVTVSVSNINEPPEPLSDAYAAISGNARLLNVLSNDSDPDGDTLYLASVTNGDQGGSARIVNGQVEVTAGLQRTENFTYTVRDRQSGGLQASSTLTVTVNRHPVLQTETFQMLTGEFRALDVLANDSDPDAPYGAQPMKIYAVTGINGGASAAPSSTGAVVNYTAPDTPGTYYFTYWVTDQTGGVSSIRSYVSVALSQRPPDAVNDTYSMTAGEILVLPVLSNDTDLNDDDLLVTGVSAVSGGASAQVMPDQKAVSYFAPQQAGSYTFNYTISDGQGGTDTATVTVNVTGGCGGFICLPGF